MPVSVRRFCTSILLTLSALVASLIAQTTSPNPPTDTQSAAQPPQTVRINAPTSAEIMRERISKAKAFIAVRNYSAAIYELENIRRETSDQSVQAVTNVLLMNSYLEQGDYKRAQEFLTQGFNIQKSSKPGSAEMYNAIAGQVTKSARTKLERYKALGLVVSDRSLPLEAVNDIERMREMLELVITQAKEMSKTASRTVMAMAMIEEASASRSALARDDYDARRWNDELADSREEIASSRSVITNAVDGTTAPSNVPTQAVAANTQPENIGDRATQATVSERSGTESTPPAAPPRVIGESPEAPAETKASSSPNGPITVSTPVASADKASQQTTANDKQATPEPGRVAGQAKQIVVENPRPQNEGVKKPASEVTTAAKEDGPIDVGSLVDYATRRSAPVYPAVARTMRTTGVVRVEVTIDEDGAVAEVQGTSGPTLLQAAAREAIRKWRFKPFTRDGQPVRAIGFVNFNFSL